MEVKLRVVGGKNAGQELPVAGPRFIIGRGRWVPVAGQKLADCRAALRARACSRAGAFARPGKQRRHVRERPAGSGTRDMKIGDQLRVGPLTFELCLDAKLAGKKKPKVSSIGEAAARLAGGQKPEPATTASISTNCWAKKPDNRRQLRATRRSLSDEEQQALGLKPRNRSRAGKSQARGVGRLRGDSPSGPKSLNKSASEFHRYPCTPPGHPARAGRHVGHLKTQS